MPIWLNSMARSRYPSTTSGVAGDSLAEPVDRPGSALQGSTAHACDAVAAIASTVMSCKVHRHDEPCNLHSPRHRHSSPLGARTVHVTCAFAEAAAPASRKAAVSNCCAAVPSTPAGTIFRMCAPARQPVTDTKRRLAHSRRPFRSLSASNCGLCSSQSSINAADSASGGRGCASTVMWTNWLVVESNHLHDLMRDPAFANPVRGGTAVRSYGTRQPRTPRAGRKADRRKKTAENRGFSKGRSPGFTTP